MRARHLTLSIAIGLAILAFVVGLGFALWWLMHSRQYWAGTPLLMVGLAVAIFVLATARRAAIGWTVLFLATFILLFISVASPFGFGPYFGPVGLLFLALCLWVLFQPAHS